MNQSSVFISYSRKDEKEKDELIAHLRVLGQTVEVWSDKRIGAGMQQALRYAEMIDIPFAYSTNGDGFVEHLLDLCDALEAKLRSAREERIRLTAAVLAGVGNGAGGK